MKDKQAIIWNSADVDWYCLHGDGQRRLLLRVGVNRIALRHTFVLSGSYVAFLFGTVANNEYVRTGNLAHPKSLTTKYTGGNMWSDDKVLLAPDGAIVWYKTISAGAPSNGAIPAGGPGGSEYIATWNPYSRIFTVLDSSQNLPYQGSFITEINYLTLHDYTASWNVGRVRQSAVIGPGPAPPPTCSSIPVGSSVIAEDSQALIVGTAGPNSTETWSFCLRPSGLFHVLATFDIDTTLGPMALDGTHVAFTSYYSYKAVENRVTLTVGDLSTHSLAQLDVSSDFFARIVTLLIAPDGTALWLDNQYVSEPLSPTPTDISEIDTYNPANGVTRVTTLDSGKPPYECPTPPTSTCPASTAGDLTDLQLNGATATWLHDGQPRSAVIK